MTTNTTQAPAGEVAPILDPERTYELDRKHVFHSWSAQGKITPMTITSAQGSHVWDGDGQALLDFSSQLVFTNIGHQHPKVIAGIQEQAARLATIAPQHANDARSEAARLIAELTPGDLNKIFFTNGGADAIEHAVRMARLHTGRNKVLSRYRSYHGGTQTAINLTGDSRRWPNDLGTAGVVHFFGPYLYRSRFNATTEAEEGQRALEHLKEVIELEGPDTIAAIVLESIPGTAGIMLPPPGYLRGVRELCDRYGIIYIADEVMAGFGRAGKWFAVEHDGVTPDLITFAKGVTSGYVPLGGVAINAEIAATFDQRPYPGGLTYSGHPLAAGAAVATINAMREENVLARAEQIGTDHLGPALRALTERHPSVGEVRGTAVFWAVELVRDPATREPLGAEQMGAVMAECKRLGLLPMVTANRVHMVPPCTVSAEEVRQAVDILDQALAVADAAVGA